MRFLAFKSILGAIVLTTAALSTHIAKAEATLNVPFSFTVSGQSMPAGVYTVQQNLFHNTVTLRSKNASKSFAYSLGPGEAVGNEDRVTLKFSSSGATHTLRSIQFGSKMTPRLDERPRPPRYEPARLSQGR